MPVARLAIVVAIAVAAHAAAIMFAQVQCSALDRGTPESVCAVHMCISFRLACARSRALESARFGSNERGGGVQIRPSTPAKSHMQYSDLCSTGDPGSSERIG